MEEKPGTYSFAKRHGVLVGDYQHHHVNIIHRPDYAVEALLELRRYIGLPLVLEEVSEERFTILLTKHYETKVAAALQVAEDIEEDLDLQELMEDLPNPSDLLESENDAPVIRLINALLREAIKQTASDIHFEPFEKTLVIRLRVNGVLRNVLEVPHILSPLIISRIKVMSSLDISEKRLPQDGRITVKIAGRSVDIRVSTIPVSHGERVVLRLLDKKSIHLSLTELGVDESLLKIISRMIAKPHGIILVTGPTGSGKTTSLYAMLTELNVPGRNIMTVEDPIEYDLKGIGQIQVNTKVDMTFAKSLRAILRQDPNVIMVGEIRDLETAMIAVQASLTGHLVFSTLHTNSAIGTITRLRDMGVESFLLASSLVGIIAQRLVRVLCQHCKEGYQPTSKEVDMLGIAPGAQITIYRPHGCDYCNQTGYTHRMGIFEIIEINEKLRALIHSQANDAEIKDYLKSTFKNIWQHSCEQVILGNTSLEEILRIASE